MKNDQNNTKEQLITGPISISGKGVGFVSQGPDTEKGDDIMIEMQNLNTALHRDVVEVRILPQKVYNRTTGEVTKIVERKNRLQFVGTIDTKTDSVWLMPDDNKMYMDIVLPKEKAGERVHDGDKVLAEVIEWKPGKSPMGKVVKVIGKKGEHNAEVISILMDQGFDTEYPEDVMREAKQIYATAFPVPEAEIAKRRDFRQTLTMTIDPKDAKDFDDALSFKKLPNGHYEIGVHIADVSHYVRPGTPLDREAHKRGCSVYLVDRTIPMLPHELSNIVCSLNPDEDRLVFSAVFEMDENAEIYDRWFGKSIIHSHRRFSYEEAQDLLNKAGKGEKDEKEPDTQQVLVTMNAIAKKMEAANKIDGAISFETTEIKFELDEKGVPLRVVKKERLDTHKMIEQYMLLGNREVAEFIYNKDLKVRSKTEGLMYRTHDSPNPDKIKDLAVLVRAMGYQLPLNKDGSVTV
jgi:ribonuclease R